jgi:long-chain fatty acid transport protein
VAYDETPVTDSVRTARIPDENRSWLAIGGQYHLSDNSAIDVGYAHLFIQNAQINKFESGVTLTGTYDSSVDILSAQYTHNF